MGATTESMQRHATLIAFAALLVASLALAVGLVGPGESEVGGEPALEAPRLDPSEEVLALGRRVEELAGEFDLARAEIAALRGEGREPADLRVDPEVDERITRLERALEEARRGGAAEGTGAVDGERIFARLDERSDRERSPRSAPNLDELTASALDPTGTEEQRIQALRRLRGQRLADGSDARSPAVVAEMIAIGEGSADARLRADAWRQLSGVGDPQLVTPLLASLAHDPDARVREEAAETLGDFLPDANVQAALQYAMQNDSDDRVRRQAAESLH